MRGRVRGVTPFTRQPTRFTQIITPATRMAWNRMRIIKMYKLRMPPRWHLPPVASVARSFKHNSVGRIPARLQRSASASREDVPMRCPRTESIADCFSSPNPHGSTGVAVPCSIRTTTAPQPSDYSPNADGTPGPIVRERRELAAVSRNDASARLVAESYGNPRGICLSTPGKPVATAVQITPVWGPVRPATRSVDRPRAPRAPCPTESTPPFAR